MFLPFKFKLDVHARVSRFCVYIFVGFDVPLAGAFLDWDVCVLVSLLTVDGKVVIMINIFASHSPRHVQCVILGSAFQHCLLVISPIKILKSSRRCFHHNFIQDELISYLSWLSSPLIILGDSNELSFHHDKLGGSKFRFSRLTYMNMLFGSIECIELPFECNFYKWREKNLMALIIFSSDQINALALIGSIFNFFKCKCRKAPPYTFNKL